MPSNDVSTHLATSFAPTLVIFPEDHSKIPYGDPRPLPEETGDYHPSPVELVLDNSWLYRKGRRFRHPLSLRRGRPRQFSSEREWLWSLVRRNTNLSKAVINLRGVEIDRPSTVWDTYFSLISSLEARRCHGSRADQTNGARAGACRVVQAVPGPLSGNRQR